MNRINEMSLLGRVILLVTKKFARTVYFNSNIRSKLFGTQTAAELTQLTQLTQLTTLKGSFFLTAQIYRHVIDKKRFRKPDTGFLIPH